MGKIPVDYVEKVYSGWLGKVIGVRHGAPTEGWDCENISRLYGEISGYLVEYKKFAADDDINGPMFFLRALEDYSHLNVTEEQIGLTWLNYVPYEHGFFWWGGYGKSTEHTAYLNLKNGIMAPRSGSAQQNGSAIAEQIGGQIFIDTWGLISPGNPPLAAEYARKAASVSHDGEGIYGGMFIAACISAAFTETDLMKIVYKGLSVIPEDSGYRKMVMDILDFYTMHPSDWRICFDYVRDKFGYNHYPGICHIIPNSAVIILSLLYSEGDFSKAINISNMCGWDTDCNTGNVGAIMGVRNGVQGIDFDKWIKPVNDSLVFSSVMGSLNITDIPACATYIAGIGYKISAEIPPLKWKEILSGNAARFHFEYPGSTHGFEVRCTAGGNIAYSIENSDKYAYSGRRSLKVSAYKMEEIGEMKIFSKTYYRPGDFYDSRYDPAFSPVLYPGQTIEAAVLLPDYIKAKIQACLYVYDGNKEIDIESDKIMLTRGVWQYLNFRIPALSGACIEEAGIKVVYTGEDNNEFEVFIDDFKYSGTPDYTLDFSKERMEVWTQLHREVSQLTYLKGIWELEEGELSGSCCDLGEAYTGSPEWKDYLFEAVIVPKIGDSHCINFRVQGATRSYALGLFTDNKLILYKNDNGYRVLKSCIYKWEYNSEYMLKIKVDKNIIKVYDKGGALFEFKDNDGPYLKGHL